MGDWLVVRQVLGGDRGRDQLRLITVNQERSPWGRPGRGRCSLKVLEGRSMDLLAEWVCGVREIGQGDPRPFA